MGVLHNRITTIKPLCERCGRENEFLNHMLFFCDSSRAICFASPLALRVDELPLTFTTAFQSLVRTIQVHHHQLLFNLIWCIWKAKNEHTFEEKMVNSVKVIERAQGMALRRDANKQQVQTAATPVWYRVWKQETVMVINGSWQAPQRAGVAALLYGADRGLCWIVAKSTMAQDPFQAEVMTIEEALDQIRIREPQWRLRQINIFSDCKVLIEALKKGDITEIPSWRAAGQIVKSQSHIQKIGAKIRLHHAKRKHWLSYSQLELECDLGKLGELFGGNGNFGCFVDKRDN
jgi:hypothetical protein